MRFSHAHRAHQITRMVVRYGIVPRKLKPWFHALELCLHFVKIFTH